MASIKRHLVLGSLLIGALAVPVLASADDSSTTPVATPVATPTPLAWYQQIQVGGYLDAYYQMNLNRPSDTQSSNSNTGCCGPSGYANNNNAPLAYRAYDNTENQFTLGGAELTLKDNDASSGTGFFLDLLVGQTASVYDPFDDSTELQTGSSSILSQDGVNIGQAYITQAFGNSTFTLGKFATPIGYESTYLPSNANFSRSLLYQAEPTFSLGLEAAYTLPAGFSVAGWVDNGNSTDDAINNGRGYGLQAGYAGIKNLNLTGTWYYQDNLGNEQIDDNIPESSNIAHSDLFDFVATYAATDSLNFAGEYLNLTTPGVEYQYYGGNWYGDDYTQQSGYALYATYSPFANFSISPRFTQFFSPNDDDPQQNGSSTSISDDAPYVLDDYTLTLKYQMGSLAHILEYQADASDRYEFFSGSDASGKYTQIQQTLTYAAVYSF